MAVPARDATVGARSWLKNIAFAQHVREAGFAFPLRRPPTPTGRLMDEQVNIESLLEEIGKRQQAFIERQRKLVRTIDVALVILAAFAGISILVWLL
jgi:hypothetical protein